MLIKFLQYLKLRGVSSASLKYYKSDITNFINWAGEREITAKLIREYIKAQTFTSPKTTINRRLSTLRSYSQFLGRNFMLGVNNVTDVKSVQVPEIKVPKTSAYRFLQEKILARFERKPRVQNAFFKLFFARPNWYKTYHTYPIASYIHIAILVLFTSLSGYALYDQVFRNANNPLAFPVALTRPNRYLSFQGRLTSNVGNPITTATNLVFKLYDASTAGTELWTSGTCSITPDQDGIFSTLLGSSCGAEIAATVFSENASVWVGVTVAADAEATPRVQIATVAYALNSETLQGYPAGTGTSTIPYINSTGALVLANASPTIQSTSGTFAVEGLAMTITTPNASDGIITINPDGIGTLDLTFEGAAAGASANGFVNATNANITSGALYGGTVASAATGYNFIDFQSGVSPTSKFSVSAVGNTYVAGTLGVGIASPAATALLDLTSTTKGFLAPRMTTTQRDAISTPATGLMIYNTTDNQYNVFDGTVWGAVGGGGGAWSDLTVPTANLSLAHAGYTTAFTFNSVTTADAFALSSSSLTTGTILDLSSTSTAGGASGLSKVLDIGRSGTNANASHTAYGLYSAVTNTGTTSTNVGGYFSASGATNNYAAIFNAGNVGIGTTSPSEKLVVEGGDVLFNSTSGSEYVYINRPATSNAAAIQFQTAGSSDWVMGPGYSGTTSDFRFYKTAATAGDVMTLTTAGNVGIGTTVPGSRLEIKSSGATSSTSGLNVTTSGGSSVLFVRDDSRIGIGTTAPTASLHILSTDSTGILLERDGQPTFQADGYGTGNVPLFISRQARGTRALPTASQADDSLFSFTARGYGTTGFSAGGKASLGMKASENWTDSAQGTYITFGTTPNLNTTIAERMRIDNAGNVGIGTTAPSQLLHISKSQNDVTALQISNTNAGTSARVRLVLQNDVATVAALNLLPSTHATYPSAMFYVNDILDADVFFRTTKTTTGAIDHIQLDGSTGNTLLNQSYGNVGIGTTAPTTALHIGTNAETHALSTGDALISSDLEVDGVVYLDGGLIANSAGTTSIALSATPTTVANTLSASNWLIENTANVGQAALIINQQKAGDLFTASASGTPKFTIANTGAITSAIGSWTSQVADSATAVGFTFNTSNTLSTQGSKLLSFQNLGTEKMYLDKDGNLYVSGTVLSGNGISMLLTNKSGGVVASKAIVVLDTSNNTSFTTTTTPYSKSGFGVVVGVGLGVTNDADGDGVCDADDICMVAYAGSVNVTVKNATTAVKGDYLFTSDTAGSAVASAKQYDGLVGIVDDTTNSASGYLRMIFKVQPQVTAAAAIDKGTKHNEYWLYADQYQAVGEGSNTDTNLLQRGLAFDTFTDSTKTDSANTTVSYTPEGRVGLIGGQTLATSTTDNDGQTYLGSNTVNDTFYYDRAQRGQTPLSGVTGPGDSSPQVQVELGIDPNWYNGVTLSVATTSASFSQNSVITQPNPNLSTSYNGSLIKVTGTDSTPRTIYITIKSPTTFDWTNYNGQAATGVTITPGTAQTLGGTGVSATFTNARYNTGDVFKIASWFIEAESATRGAKQQFPERSNVIATASSVDVIDADTQKLWMRFSQGTSYAIGVDANNDPSSANMLNGKAYISTNGSAATGLYTLDFAHDAAFKQNATDYRLSDTALYGRNGTNTYNVINTSNILVNITANDVSAAVIPNQPTQTMTVSGWGYKIGDGVNGFVLESVNLPYKFNGNPVVSAVFAGYKDSTDPVTSSDCGSAGNYHAGIYTITSTSFGVNIQDDAHTAIGATRRICYTWTATGQVSPRQYVATATDGGISIINETDQSVVNITTAGYNKTPVIFLTNKGHLYYARRADASDTNWAIEAGPIPPTNVTSTGSWRTEYYDSAGAGNSPALVGGVISTDINSLYVTEGTSTIDGKSNTIYVGTEAGATVIQEKQSGTVNEGSFLDDKNASVKYYTKDYISEEMVGDIRGMWPLNGSGSIANNANISDASVKGQTLTAKNSNGTGLTYATGVRGTAITFDGTDDYLCSGTGGTCSNSTADDVTTSFTIGGWVKLAASPNALNMFMTKDDAGTREFGIYINSGGISTIETFSAGGYNGLASNKAINDGNWHFITFTYDGSYKKIYIDGILDNQVAYTQTLYTVSMPLRIGQRGDLNASYYFKGSIDEPFITATPLTSGQVKHMYQVGYRALQSHGTTLGGGAADTNQQLGGTTNTIGAAQPDLNNQFMYVGTNSTTLGAVSKIDLNSDTNIKTYNSSANVPTGGPLLIDEDTKSLAVGYNLEAVGSATTGVKTMGVDNNATATSGNFIGKTVTTAESFTQAYLWAQYTLDASDASNTIQVWASNDGGSNYSQCNLTNTDTSRSPSEYEYFCQFNTPGSSLKTKFVMARGSTKTNTYVARYGISWIDSNAVAGSANGSGLFTNNNASVANGSYIDVAHNQNSNDLVTNGWVYNTATSKWEQIDTTSNEQATNSAQVNYNTEANYTQENMAYAVTLTPSATSGNITLTLGSGTWNADARIKAGTRVVGNGGIATITGTPAAQTTITATTTTNFTNTNAIASGSWYLYATTFDGSVAKINNYGSDATGGTITYNGGYTIHTFTTDGTFTPPASGNVEYLVVAGGGGGGRGFAGGGGAGGLKTGSGFAVTAQAYTITVGGGGTGSTSDGSKGSNGNNSVFSTVTATGGGGGGSISNTGGGNGGSGGGGVTSTSGGTGNSGEGNNGGTGTTDQSGGGGGGAGAVGAASYATNNGGNGGVGIASSISGSSVYYAGGGGGGSNGSTAGNGGNGGGGNGSNWSTVGSNGTANSGGGGGGGGREPGVANGNGGNGGSGVVIIRYLTNAFTSAPTSQNYSVVTNSDQLATASWDHVENAVVTETLNSQTINYSVSFDGRTTFAIYDSTTSNNGWRPIARNNSGTWQYNSNTTAGVSNVTWTSATYNSQNGALSQATGVTQNQMTGTQLNALTAVNWREINGFTPTTNTLDFAASLKTTSVSQIPQVDQIKVNYTQAGMKIVQTDANTVRLYNYSGATQNLRLDVITGGLGRNAGTVSLAPAAADVDSQTSTNSLWINKTGSGGNLLKLQTSGTDVLSLTGAGLMTLAGNFLPGTDNTYALGSTSNRWKDLFLGPTSLHISSTTGTSGVGANYVDATLGYSSNALTLATAVTGTVSGGGSINLTSGLALGNTTTSAFNFTTSADFGATDEVLQIGDSAANFMTILGNGNVGIGTTGPGSKLHVYATGYPRLKVESPSGGNPGLYLINGADSVNQQRSLITHAGGNMNFYMINDAEAVAYTPLQLLANGNVTMAGNVGIGTTGPTGKLNVRATSNYAANVGIFEANHTLSLEPATVSRTTNSGSSLAFGAFAGANITTASIFSAPENTSDYAGYLSFYTSQAGSTHDEKMRITSTGNVTGTYGNYHVASDVRLKKDIVTISGALDKVLALRGVDFKWKDGSDDGSLQMGMIAQETELVVPEVVHTSDDEMQTKAIEYPFLAGLFVEAIKGLNTKVDDQFASLSGQLAELQLTDAGDVVLTGDSPDTYAVSTPTGVTSRIGTFASATVAKLKAGIGSFRQVETSLISPIANTDLIIDLQPDNSEVASQLIIKGENDEVVTSFDAYGNATISGTLYANNIESQRLEDIEELLREVETNQTLLAEASLWNTDTATASGQFTELFVTGQAAISSLFVSDNFTTKNINSLTEPLSIQSLASAPLEIMAGKIIIDTDGNTKFLGNVEIAGDLKINNIIVANNIDPVATESGSIIEGEINSNATAGKAVLTANTEKIRINNNKVSLNTLIYITPITSTQNKVLYVKAKDEDYFEVGFSDTLDTDVEFNWWIIELENVVSN